MKSIEQTLVIKSTAGIHAELAVRVVQAATKYNVDIKLVYKDRVVDVKSILGLMSLAVPKGEDVKIIATGKEAQDAINEIIKELG